MGAATPSSFQLREIEPGTPEYLQADDVRYDALYREWGLPRSIIEDPEESALRHIAAFDGDTLVGYARIRLGEGDSRISQVAVAPERRGEGVGALLMDALERLARSAGSTQIELHARANVVGFYERQGFTAEGEEFISGRAHTPHRRMRKLL